MNFKTEFKPVFIFQVVLNFKKTVFLNVFGLPNLLKDFVYNYMESIICIWSNWILYFCSN